MTSGTGRDMKRDRDGEEWERHRKGGGNNSLKLLKVFNILSLSNVSYSGCYSHSGCKLHFISNLVLNQFMKDLLLQHNAFSYRKLRIKQLFF